MGKCGQHIRTSGSKHLRCNRRNRSGRISIQAICTLTVGFLLSGCTGQIDTGSPGAQSGTDANNGLATAPATSEPVCDELTAGEAPLRRITKSEYRNIAADLFAYEGTVLDALDDDNVVDGFDNNVGNASVSQLRTERFFDAAEAMSVESIDLTTILPCETQTVDNACIDRFIETLGRRVWRRPLDHDETAVFRSVFEANREEDLSHRLGAILEAMLVAPQFLFRPELGTPSENNPNILALTDHELATRLAFFLWVSTPDDILLDAADAGEISTSAQIEDQARRMMEDPKSRRGIRHFILQWIDARHLHNISRSADLYPEFDGQLVNDMHEEIERFIDQVIWDQGGSIEELISSNEAQVNARMAALYGLDHPGGNEWVSMSLPTEERRGLLTRAAFLTGKAHSIAPAPVQRGAWVRTRLLCDPIPDPPDDVDISPPEPSDAQTNRELLEEHSSNERCAGCHNLMDPIGFSFEHYDSIGRFSTEDHNGFAIDASGELEYTDDVNGPFRDALELSDRLAESDDVASCLATQAFRYAQGRRAEEEDACSLSAIRKHRKASIKDLLVSLTLTDGFRYRHTDNGD